MFRRTTKWVSVHHERIISLVLLPAFFFASMPHIACICADGHREAFCKTALCRAIGNGTNRSDCGGYSCCNNRGSGPVRSCCQGKACPSPGGGTTPLHGIGAKTGSCCHPVIEAPSPAITSGKTDLTSQAALIAMPVPPTTFIFANELHPELSRSDFSAPPPLDAVIVFLHLTI
jgi:hypothetical protein